MHKVVVLSCTNRTGSNTLKVARIYEHILHSLGTQTEFLDFQNLPATITATELYGKRTPGYDDFIKQYISANTRFVFVSPEYNGSYPGILKVFLESMHPREWANKRACLVGVSDGRAGNLRGMEHLTGVLQYLKLHVYHNKLPISVVGKLLDENGGFNSPEQQKVCEMQMRDFLAF